MSCRAGFDNLFIMTTMNKNWFQGEYRQRRRALLWEREQARLPEAMEIVEREREADRLEKLAAEARVQALEMQRRGRELLNEAAALLQAADRVRSGEGPAKKKRAFLVGCSWNDCRGYLSDDHSCKLCSRQTCPRCLSPSDDGHVCDPDALSTAALLRKETKPCPGCGEGIQKTEGCDQMWCLSCHTAFSWKTGVIDRGVIHNPEFYRWQREQGGDLPRQPGDEPCGGRVGYRRFLDAVSRLARTKQLGSLMRELANAHQLVQHITHVELPGSQGALRDCQDTTGIRVRYIRGDLDADGAAAEVERADRTRQRHERAQNAWQLVSVVGQELLRGLAEDLEAQAGQSAPKRSALRLTTFFEQLENLCNLANQPLFESYQGTGAAPKRITRDGGEWRITTRRA
jgi:hypothetical protein